MDEFVLCVVLGEVYIDLVGLICDDWFDLLMIYCI